MRSKLVVDTGSPDVYDEATSKQRVTGDMKGGKQHDTAASDETERS